MPDIKINGREFRAQKLPAREGTRNLFQLTKLIGPALSKLGPLVAAKDSEDAQGAAALEAVADLMKASDPDELTDFIVKLAQTAEVKTPNGSYDPVVFDLLSMSEGFLVFVFILRVNYADFFAGELGKLIQQAGVKAA